jgi:hypothetical protein
LLEERVVGFRYIHPASLLGVVSPTNLAESQIILPKKFIASQTKRLRYSFLREILTHDQYVNFVTKPQVMKRTAA